MESVRAPREDRGFTSTATGPALMAEAQALLGSSKSPYARKVEVIKVENLRQGARYQIVVSYERKVAEKIDAIVQTDEPLRDLTKKSSDEPLRDLTKKSSDEPVRDLTKKSLSLRNIGLTVAAALLVTLAIKRIPRVNAATIAILGSMLAWLQR